jgi:lauroyl/myristoyl acyltransferase
MKKLLLIAVNTVLIPLYASVYLLAFALAWLPLFPCRVGVKNLRTHLDYGFLSSRFAIASVFFHYFLYLVEAAIIWPLGLTTFKNVPETTEFLRSMQTKYRLKEKNLGFALLGGHFGNIEALGQGMNTIFEDQLDRRIVALAQPAHFSIITKLTRWYRTRRRIRTEFTSAKFLIPSMKRLANSGISMALLIDQKPRRDGIFIDFFGTPSAFPWRGVELLLAEGCPALHFTMRRIIPGFFEILFSEGKNVHLKEYDGCVKPSREIRHFPPGASAATSTVIEAFVIWFEGVVKKYPLQWCWDYKKWSRKLPD